MSEKFEFNCDIPYNRSRFIEMTEGYILEVCYDETPSNPMGNMCAGDYGYGESYYEAYNDAWNKMDSDITDAIKEKVAQFLFDHMKVEDGVIQEHHTIAAPTTEYESKVITFPDIIDKMCIAIDDEALAELTPDELFEMVTDDYYDPFCGGNGRFSFEEMADFCDLHDIDLSNIVLLDIYRNGRDISVVFIEPQSFKDFSGEELSEAPAELKQSVLKETMQMIEDYDMGNVYGWILYDKTGQEFDSCWGLYGDDCIKDVVENFDGWTGNIDPVKDLGIHKDIANCLYDNRHRDDEER